MITMIDKSQRRTSDALPNSLAPAGCSSLIMMMPCTTVVD
jgi:hypothetical protein